MVYIADSVRSQVRLSILTGWDLILSFTLGISASCHEVTEMSVRGEGANPPLIESNGILKKQQRLIWFQKRS